MSTSASMSPTLNGCGSPSSQSNTATSSAAVSSALCNVLGLSSSTSSTTARAASPMVTRPLVSSPISSVGRPLKLRRVNHSDELVNGFTRLLSTGSMTDVTLICKGGQTIRAHRVILSTFSPYFRCIFEAQPFANNPCQYPVIVIKDLELSELRTIVDFIYKGEVSVSREKLSLVLQAARALEVSGLSDLKLDQLSSGGSLLASSSEPADPLHVSVAATSGHKRGSLSSPLELELTAAKKLRVQLEEQQNVQNDLLLLGGLGTSNSLLDTTLNIDGMRSLLQPQNRQNVAQAKNKASLSQLNAQIAKQKQVQALQALVQQRQAQARQIQNKIQMHQFKQQMLQLNQQQQGARTHKGGPRVSSLQGAQLAQFQQRLKQQMQEKQRQQNEKEKCDESKDDIKTEEEHDADKDVEDDDDCKQIDDCSDMVETQLLIDDENNNSIAPANGSDEVDAGDEEASAATGNGAEEPACDVEPASLLAADPDEEEDVYEVQLDKDAFFQQQQQLRFEQLQKQQHFKEQFQLMHVGDSEQNLFDLQDQLQRATNGNATSVSAAAGQAAAELLDSLGLSTSSLTTSGRRQSGKDSLLQNSSASGSEDTDNDNNTMDTLTDGFFDEYSNLCQKSPIQVKLDTPMNTMPPTPDFLLPRGPGRPRKGNKASDISPCPECNKVFVRPDVLKLHYRSVHLNERHPCNLCPKIFKWPGDLSKHKRTKHPEAFPPANSMLAIK